MHSGKKAQCILVKSDDFENTAISINVVGLKRQAYATRPNGGLGIHWNLHIVYSENYKILFLCVKPELAGSACLLSGVIFPRISITLA